MTASEDGIESQESQECRELVERITASVPFQRSTRLRDLLIYLTDETLSGRGRELTENQIGRVVFHKAASYSPVEDSSVRVHVRQLRLKLHEYFDGEGRSEKYVIEIPKGSYSTSFRPATAPAASTQFLATPVAVPEPLVDALPTANRAIDRLPWFLCGLLFVALVGVTLYPRLRTTPDVTIPWPLSTVFESSHRTVIVLADANYGMLRILGQHAGTLEEYLQPQYPLQFLPKSTAGQSPLVTYVTDSSLTSYADVIAATRLMNRTHALNSQTLVRSSRNLQMRDLDQGNFVFLGSPGANPWVTLFTDKLNFREVDKTFEPGTDGKYFANLNPEPGEQKVYKGLKNPGEAGVDYATIAMLPGLSGQGHVLLIEGLQQEGTEAAAEFLTNQNQMLHLRQALHLSSADIGPVNFEVLIRTRALAGMPSETEIVAVRRVNP